MKARNYLSELTLSQTMQFNFFIKELVANLSSELNPLSCPYNSYVDEWFDEDGKYIGKSFCDVTHTTNYDGEVDTNCTGEPALCWIRYVMETCDIDHLYMTPTNILKNIDLKMVHEVLSKQDKL